MEQNRKDQKFSQTPGKKSEMPERGEKRDIGSGPRTTTRPEIDLPLKGGRSDADLSKNQPRREDDTRRDNSRTGDRNDYEKSSR